MGRFLEIEKKRDTKLQLLAIRWSACDDDENKIKTTKRSGHVDAMRKGWEVERV